jgi:CheY-like chemotaxis protein
VRPTADAKGIALNAVLGSDSDSVRVSGDPDRLQQVLWNLLSNAIKFTPRGGQIDVQLDKVQSHVELRVRDTGHGIPQDFLPYVFDRFRQADGTSARKFGGLGLGLAIVRHLVELHGGRVHVYSAGEGHGATFTVALPIRAVHTDPRESVHPSLVRGSPYLLSDLPSLADLRVLVVDDDADARDLVTAVLEPCGANVTAVASVEEALCAIAKAQPDVLISDIGMAGEDGYALVRKLRALDPAQGGRIPAAALTAYARPEDRSRILAEGFQLHMAKPVDPAELIAAVGQLVGRWTATQYLAEPLQERQTSVS